MPNVKNITYTKINLAYVTEVAINFLYTGKKHRLARNMTWRKTTFHNKNI